MPSRFNRKAEIGTYHNASDSNDMDNVFLTEKGWVYRHYKSEDFSRYWDEVLIPGDVPAAVVNGVSNAPLSVFMDEDANIHFENSDGEGNPNSTDGQPDITYSPNFTGQPKVFTPLGSISVVLTHVFDTEDHVLHDGETGQFHAEVTFTPADDHPDATLADVEDDLEFHWTHDGQHNDGDDIVGRDGEDVSYQFDSVGHHIVSVTVTGDNISNSGIAGDTDEFDVYGHIDNLTLSWDHVDDDYVRGDDNKPTVFTVGYEGNIEGDVTVTDVKVIDNDNFIQDDWYELETNGDDTFNFHPLFGYKFGLEVTVEHPLVATPFVQTFNTRTAISNSKFNLGHELPDADLGGRDPYGTFGDWYTQPLRRFGNRQRGIFEGCGGDDPITVGMKLDFAGSYTDHKVLPERVPHTVTPVDSAYYINDQLVGHSGHGQYTKHKRVSLKGLVESEYMKPGQGPYEATLNVYAHAVCDGQWSDTVTYQVRTYGIISEDRKNVSRDESAIPTLRMTHEDNHNVNWVGDTRYIDDEMNRVIFVPSNVDNINIKLTPRYGIYSGMADFAIVMHNRTWGSTETDSRYFGSSNQYIDEDNQQFTIRTSMLRSYSWDSFRISTVDEYKSGILPNELHDRMHNDRSVTFVLLP